MKRLTVAAPALVLAFAGALALAGPVFAQGSVGGPTKQTGLGQPTKPPSPLMPSQKTGTVTVPTMTQNASANSGKKTKK
jgi:hypothetical protein